MTLIDIKNFKTDLGTLGEKGNLGYRDYIVSLDKKYLDWNVLGIHCDSELNIQVNEPIMLAGGLNGTGIFYDRSPRVRFFINDVPFGESEKPQQMTDHIVLATGQHTLRTKLIDPAPDIALHFHVEGIRETLAHTVWAYKKSSQLAKNENTLFTSAFAFGKNTVSKTKIFTKSVVKHNIPFESYDDNEFFIFFMNIKLKIS